MERISIESSYVEKKTYIFVRITLQSIWFTLLDIANDDEINVLNINGMLNFTINV